MAIFFGNGVNAAVAVLGLLNRRPRGPNLVHVPCETEENEQMVQPKGLTEQLFKPNLWV